MDAENTSIAGSDCPRTSSIVVFNVRFYKVNFNVAQNQISLYVLYLNKVEYKLLSRMSVWLLCNAK
jgi:hypothetical protein